MLERGKIDSGQAILLMISTILPTAILTIPSVVARSARQDAWLSVILATAVGLVIARLVVTLSLRFPGKTLFQYAEEILGKVPGKIVGLLYIWWLLHTNGLIIDVFASFLCVAMMPDTPFMIFFLVGIAVAAYAVRNGLEVLSRFNQMFLPHVMTLLLAVFILTVKDMKLARLLPVLDSGLSSVVKGAATPASWLGEIVIFSMFIPYLRKPSDAHRVAMLAILGTSLFMAVSILVTLLTFGPNMTSHWTFPVFSAVRAVSVAGFLERLESVTVAVWIFGGIAKIGVFYYAAVLGSAQWLGLKDYRPLVAPVGVVLMGLASLCPSIVDLFDFIAGGWPPYALIVFEAGIPLALLIVAFIRGRGGENR
ncbi:MAG: endospore germination permease [Firmicutes bacterium]|nr:endospore germination permease [Bacillota bacterium]